MHVTHTYDANAAKSAAAQRAQEARRRSIVAGPKTAMRHAASSHSTLALRPTPALNQAYAGEYAVDDLGYLSGALSSGLSAVLSAHRAHDA